MLLPGKVGFAEETVWRFNPSYLPPQLARYLTRFGEPSGGTAGDQSPVVAGDGAEGIFAGLGAL